MVVHENFNEPLMKTFREALQGKAFTITADLTLNSSSGADDIARQVDLLGPYVDGLQVTDSPWAWVQMSALSAAALVQRHGIDPIAILTCRDRNRVALQSDLLGLRALGVRSLLLMRGHKMPKEHPVPATPVYDVSGLELVKMAAQLGAAQGGTAPDEFYIGAGARAFRPERDWDAESLTKRFNAGARFLQTQLCFNMDILRCYMQHMVETRMTWKYSVIISLTPLPSVATARWLKKSLIDSRIPRSVIASLEQAADPTREGVAICAGLMQEIAEIPGVSGVNLMTTGDPELLRDAIKASGLR
jgi:methylenetetrahydrofolate reductase (NADPH)